MKKIKEYLSSVVKEVKKVKWPTKKEMIKHSITTIVFILFFSIFFYGFTLLFSFLKSLVK